MTDLSRREFLRITAGGVALVGIGGCAAEGGKAGGDTVATGTVLNPIPAVAEATKPGVWRVPGGGKVAAGGALFFKAGEEPGVLLTVGGELRALSAQCTHAGCTVNWENNQLRCPCHNSNFNASGAVLNGPATKPLPTWKVQLDGDDAIVST